MTTQSEKDRVVIFDTTLRDGEQCPGATMTHEEKIEVAELLDTMGVDVIEAGFPIASDGDFAAVNEIAKRTRNAVVCGLSRAAFNDIDRCAEAIKPAERKRIHTFLSTSPVHMKWKLQKEPHQVLDMVIAQVTRARNHVDDVDAHGVEQFGDFDLFLVGHRRAGALLAVAQRRVEDDDAVFLGLGGGHGTGPS